MSLLRKRKKPLKKKTSQRALKNTQPSAQPKLKPKPRKIPLKVKTTSRKERSLWERSKVARQISYYYIIPWGALLGLIIFGGWSAWGYVYHLPEFQVKANRMLLKDRPTWLTGYAEQRINKKTFRSLSLSIFDPKLTLKIRQAYENDPRVMRVESVSKHFPNQVKVKLVLRRPLARVRHSRVKHSKIYSLLDRTGNVLDVLEKESSDAYQYLPWIKGVSRSAPAPGNNWTDSGIKAALEVLAILERNQLLEPLNLQTIEVSNIGGKRNPRKSEIVLILPNRVRILWGRVQNRYGEVSVEKKINKIRTLLKETKGLDNLDWNIRFSNGGVIPNRRG